MIFCTDYDVTKIIVKNPSVSNSSLVYNLTKKDLLRIFLISKTMQVKFDYQEAYWAKTLTLEYFQ